MTTELDTILFIKCLGDGKANPFLPEPKRKRISFFPLEILYQIYLYQKNVDRGAWNDIHTMKETIAEHVGCSRTTVTNFFNSKTFGVDLFVGVARYSKRVNGKFQSNRYWLKPGIQEAMRILERKGFFKGMKKDRLKWRKWFDERCEKWLIPLLEKGLSFSEILKGDANILSTKNKAKLAAVETRKVADTTLPPESSLYNTKVYNDNGNPTLSVPLQAAANVVGILRDVIHIGDQEIQKLMMNNSLNALSRAAKDTIDRLDSGDRRPVHRKAAYLQSCLNRHNDQIWKSRQTFGYRD